MPKYYKRKYYRGGSRDKYSVEQTAGTVSTNESGDGGVTVVAAAAVQGMRKVKHLTVDMAHTPVSSAPSYEYLYWALVYVPQGTVANTLSIDGSTMYEPNQYVLRLRLSGQRIRSGPPSKSNTPQHNTYWLGSYIVLPSILRVLATVP